MEEGNNYDVLAAAIMDYGISRDQLAQAAILRRDESFEELRDRKARISSRDLGERDYFQELSRIVEECVLIVTKENPEEYAQRLKERLEGRGNIHFR